MPLNRADMDDDHVAVYTSRENGETEVRCSCSAFWIHKKGETIEKIESIYNSHLAYFKHPKMTTL